MNDVSRNEIFETLKIILKEKNISYKMLAELTEIPESTLKKNFAKSDCSLARLTTICEAIELSLIDLITQIGLKKKNITFSFTKKQEEFFAENIEYYLFFHALFRSNHPLEKAKKLLNLNGQKYWKIIKKLEEFDLIELRENDKIHFKVQGGLIFRQEGELQKKILDLVTTKFTHFLINTPVLDDPVESPFTRLFFAKVSKETYQKLIESLMELNQQFQETSLRDRKYLKEDGLVDITWLLGVGQCNGIEL